MEMEIHCLQWSQRTQVLVEGGDDFFGLRSPLFTPRLSLFGWMHPHHRSLTVLMSLYEYDKWSDKVEMGIHCLQWSQQAQKLVEGGDDLGLMRSGKTIFSLEFIVCNGLNKFKF